ncbi:hypothetical protein [Draconibacterium sediminis]|uniref:hypothetical protein n=1 Tax=Draconibacterium sediminis TaxID=1544798 RepID=UPI0026EA9CF6|nr:hypothetical protein [Draconibacterium sediminis]
MKHTSVILLFALLFSCSTTGKLTDEVFKSTLIGKSEMEIYARLGQPAKTVPIADGGKEVIYEFYGRDISLVPDKSPVVINSPGAIELPYSELEQLNSYNLARLLGLQPKCNLPESVV